MREVLPSHGYKLAPGTMYPLLPELERAGYLRGSAGKGGGRDRRYYRITPRGRRALRVAQRRISELVREVWTGRKG